MTRKKFTDEFRKEAVQLVLTSGLTRDQVAYVICSRCRGLGSMHGRTGHHRFVFP